MEDRPEATSDKIKSVGALSFKDLIDRSSKWDSKLNEVNLTDDEERRLKRLGLKIKYSVIDGRNKGHGYISSSSGYDKEKELKLVSYVARCFREGGVQPVVVSIDEFYRFYPVRLSLVRKTLTFDRIAENQQPEQDFAIILTGFTESAIFTQQILDQVPYQPNAGLDVSSERTQFGNDLLMFAARKLPSLIKKENGDLSAVLETIMKTGNFPEEDARLLLVTGLLLQDIQAWQDLWYEQKAWEGKKPKGTSLYIVAPKSFHDAMNRLNIHWGHIAVDYRYRAANSLGNADEPPLEDTDVETRYYKQGISGEEFQRRIGPILDRLKNMKV